MMGQEVACITPRCNKFASGLVREVLAEVSEIGCARGDAMIVASELVTNAVRHSMCSEDELLTVRVVREVDHVRISVLDPGRAGRTATLSDRPDVFGGLGLMIVERLTARWGSQRLADGYEFWAELPRATW